MTSAGIKQTCGPCTHPSNQAPLSGLQTIRAMAVAVYNSDVRCETLRAGSANAPVTTFTRLASNDDGLARKLLVVHESRMPHAYPRPQLQRRDWTSLNGEWDFALDHDDRWHHPSEVSWTSRIQVPFSPETVASGIANTGLFRACWYRRIIDAPRVPPKS